MCLGLGLSFWNLGQLQPGSPEQVQAEPEGMATLTIVEPTDQIVVDVSGAVEHPGMYQLEKDARIGQAITRAGGFRAGVDDRVVAQTINLAQKLQDEDKIYVPFESDAVMAAAITRLSGGSVEGRISVNSASVSELESLEGIGEKRAQDLIAGRPYSSLSELVERKILSNTVFEQLKEHISL